MSSFFVVAKTSKHSWNWGHKHWKRIKTPQLRIILGRKKIGYPWPTYFFSEGNLIKTPWVNCGGGERVLRKQNLYEKISIEENPSRSRKKSHMGKISQATPQKNNVKGLRILLKTSVRVVNETFGFLSCLEFI